MTYNEALDRMFDGQIMRCDGRDFKINSRGSLRARKTGGRWLAAMFSRALRESTNWQILPEKELRHET